MKPQSEARWQRYGWIMGAIWLIFLTFPVVELVAGDHSLIARVGGLVGIVAFLAVYVHGLVRIPDTPGSARAHRVGLWHVAAMSVLTAVVCVAADNEGFWTLPYVVALAILSLRVPYAVGVTTTAVAVPLILRFTGTFPPGSEFIVFIVLLVAVATALVRFVADRQHDTGSRFV